MPIRTLDHVNIRTAQLRETYAFYAELLGLTLTAPPGRNDTEMGGWLCDQQQRPVVHVAGINAPYGDGKEGTAAERGSGAVHHVAFDCVDYGAMLKQLERRGHAIRTNEVAAIGLKQIFVEDPNGIMVELNFRSA